MFTLEQSIIHHLLLKSHFIKEPGLFFGKIGVAIAFFDYGQKMNNKIFIDHGNELIDGILDGIDHKVALDFATGLAGIAWGVEYLVQNQYVEGDSNAICADLDKKIMQINIRRISDVSIETGLEGLLHYVLARMKGAMSQNNPVGFDSCFLGDIKSCIDNLSEEKISSDLQNLMIQFSSFIVNRLDISYRLWPESFYIGSMTESNIEDNQLGLRKGLAGWLY